MARNGSGTYSKVNTFVAGNTITAAGHNENWDDLVTEMTNSVAADGQTTMTGGLKLANGTAAAPALTFGTDTNNGIYRIGADNLGFTLAGSKVGDWSTTGLSITGTLTSSGAHTITSGGLTVTAGNVAITAGNFAINTNKFTVDNATGDTVVAGILGVTGVLGCTGDFAVNSNKFTVTASSGNTAVAGTLNVTGLTTLSGGVAGLIAAQSDQETATSTTLAVSPGRQHFHPSAPKAWAFVSVSAGTPTLTAGYNVTDVTDVSPGVTRVNFTNAMSASTFCAVTSPEAVGVLAVISARAVGSVTVSTTDLAGSAADNKNFSVMILGDI